MAELQDGFLPEETVLLFSGGLDSTALAAIYRPALCLVVDYGQRPAAAEARASEVITRALGLTLATLRMDLAPLGGGLLHGERPLHGAPSPEWWPYRNQFLVTAAAAVAHQRDLKCVVTGTVAGDGDRHADGTRAFYQALDTLLRLQEGSVGVVAPGIDSSTVELVARSGLGPNILGWTVSCHRSELPCGACPGCWKRNDVLLQLDMFPANR